MTPAKAIAVPAAGRREELVPAIGRTIKVSSELAVPLAVLAIVVALITPLPGFLLDLLIVADILMSVTVLMVSLYLVRPVEFSSFPTTLLLLTLFRLALNISSSRLILLNGNTGTSAAGEVIGAFGSFVVGGNYIIGTVIFLVLIAIQYVVINHGAVRISEVTARFTLDALPGKQMSIDSDLNSGLDRRNRGQAPPQGAIHGSGVLRRDGRSLALHPTRCHCEHSDYQHQHRGRIPDRRFATRHGVEQGHRDLYGADHRGRIGDGDSGADDFDLRRPDRHARQFRFKNGRRISAADLRERATAAAGIGSVDGAWPRFPDMPKLPFLLLGGGAAGRMEDEAAQGARR